MHGVVAAQSMQLGEMPGAARQPVVDLDEVELLAPRLELSGRGPELPHCQPPQTLGLPQRSSTLRIEEPDAHGPVGSVPECGGAAGAWFGHE